MTRRLALMASTLLFVLAACGGGVEVSGGASTTVGTTPTDTVTTPPTTVAGNADIPPGQDPRDILGDDEADDALANECFDGNLESCDQLFVDTPAGSDLEAYAQTCGGRIDEQDASPFCAARFEEPGPAQQPGELGDDASFDSLADDCFGGDFGACDDLYLQTPVDSAYEAYGSTCGGRLENDSDGRCDEILGGATGAEAGDNTTTTS